MTTPVGELLPDPESAGSIGFSQYAPRTTNCKPPAHPTNRHSAAANTPESLNARSAAAPAANPAAEPNTPGFARTILLSPVLQRIQIDTILTIRQRLQMEWVNRYRLSCSLRLMMFPMFAPPMALAMCDWSPLPRLAPSA